MNSRISRSFVDEITVVREINYAIQQVDGSWDGITCYRSCHVHSVIRVVVA